MINFIFIITYTYYTIFSLYLKDDINYERIKYDFCCSLQKIICLLPMHIELILSLYQLLPKK